MNFSPVSNYLFQLCQQVTILSFIRTDSDFCSLLSSTNWLFVLLHCPLIILYVTSISGLAYLASIVTRYFIPVHHLVGQNGCICNPWWCSSSFINHTSDFLKALKYCKSFWRIFHKCNSHVKEPKDPALKTFSALIRCILSLKY